MSPKLTSSLDVLTDHMHAYETIIPLVIHLHRPKCSRAQLPKSISWFGDVHSELQSFLCLCLSRAKVRETIKGGVAGAKGRGRWL